MCITSFSQQRADKLYAFSQNVHGGVSAYKTDSSGNAKRIPSGPNTMYLIYLETTPGKEVKVTELLINGLLYNFSIQETTTPVTRKIQLPGDKISDTLVAVTNQKVYRIIHHDVMVGQVKNSTMVKYPVILRYTLNGKKCTRKLKEIQHLPDVMKQ